MLPHEELIYRTTTPCRADIIYSCSISLPIQDQLSVVCLCFLESGCGAILLPCLSVLPSMSHEVIDQAQLTSWKSFTPPVSSRTRKALTTLRPRKGSPHRSAAKRTSKFPEIRKGFEMLVRAVFVGLRKAVTREIAGLAKASCPTFKVLLEIFGAVLFWILRILMGIITYVPVQIVRIAEPFRRSGTKGFKEVMVCYDPKWS